MTKALGKDGERALLGRGVRLQRKAIARAVARDAVPERSAKELEAKKRGLVGVGKDVTSAERRGLASPRVTGPVHRRTQGAGAAIEKLRQVYARSAIGSPLRGGGGVVIVVPDEKVRDALGGKRGGWELVGRSRTLRRVL